MITPQEFEKMQEEIRKVCFSFNDPGNDFEIMIGSLLRELGFFNIQRQNSGTQFGRDYTADREDLGSGVFKHWYVECKNMKDTIRPKHIADKLLWNCGKKHLTGGFALIGPSAISNELREILEDHGFHFPIFNWTDEGFAKLVLLCPEARKKWFPSINTSPTIDEARQWQEQLWHTSGSCYAPKDPLSVSVTIENDPPYRVAYFMRGHQLEKWETDFEFVHKLGFYNAGDNPLIVHSLLIRTVSYEPLPKRILVQAKMKGEFNPLRFIYKPTPRDGAAQELLRPKMRKLDPGETEIHRLQLADSTALGCYELEIEVGYQANGREFTSTPQRIRVCVCESQMNSDSGNRLSLYVHGKHYDVLAKLLLGMSEEKWKQVNAGMGTDWMVYLGPTIFDHAKGRQVSWVIQRIPIELLSPQDENREGTPIDKPEILLTLEDARGEIVYRSPSENDFVEICELYGLDYKETARDLMARWGLNLKPKT